VRACVCARGNVYGCNSSGCVGRGNDRRRPSAHLGALQRLRRAGVGDLGAQRHLRQYTQYRMEVLTYYGPLPAQAGLTAV